jgi:hypothetical protein
VLLGFDGSAEAQNAIRHAGALMPGHGALELSLAVPAKEELPLDPVGDLLGRCSGVYSAWDECVAELAEEQAPPWPLSTDNPSPRSAKPR